MAIGLLRMGGLGVSFSVFNPGVFCIGAKEKKTAKLQNNKTEAKSKFKGTVPLAERCDFTATQQMITTTYFSNIWHFGDKNLNYFERFIYIQDSG